MRLKYKINDRLEVELEAVGQKEIFKELSTLQEIFGENTCGVCKSHSVRYTVRNVEDNDFYELRCSEPGCGAILAFGQHKKGGTLFPKRKDEEGNYMQNKGWHRYTPDKKS